MIDWDWFQIKRQCKPRIHFSMNPTDKRSQPRMRVIRNKRNQLFDEDSITSTQNLIPLYITNKLHICVANYTGFGPWPVRWCIQPKCTNITVEERWFGYIIVSHSINPYRLAFFLCGDNYGGANWHDPTVHLVSRPSPAWFHSAPLCTTRLHTREPVPQIGEWVCALSFHTSASHRQHQTGPRVQA